MASDDVLDHSSICVDKKVRSKVGASRGRDSPRKRVMKGVDERRVAGRWDLFVYISRLVVRCILLPYASLMPCCTLIYMYIMYSEYDRRYPYTTSD